MEVKLNFRTILFWALILCWMSVSAHSGLVINAAGQGLQTGPGTTPASPPPAPITIRLEQPSSPLPYITIMVGLIGIFITAYYTIKRGKLDARYSFAAEILRFRLRQMEEFYAPVHLCLEQSQKVYDKLRWTIEQERKDILISNFRLLDHIYEFKKDEKLGPLVQRILAIGTRLTSLISEHSGLVEGGITKTLSEYQAHFEILNAASEQELTELQKEGWHKLGYYPRILNREILEGYKVVLEHLVNYEEAGDRLILELLGKKGLQIGKYRGQLLENLYYYEDHAKEYAAKFDDYNVSSFRDRFVEEIEHTSSSRSHGSGESITTILDAGCGTGRDTREFVKKGYQVTAVDASPAMLRECKNKLRDARQKPESPTMLRAAATSQSLEMTLDEIPFRNEFDGVWAAASLLHIPDEEIVRTLSKLVHSLKANGILYMSFKYGGGEHEYDARFYSYYSRKRVRSVLRRLRGVDEIDIWLSDAKGRNLPRARQSWAWLQEFFNRYDRSLWLNVMVAKRLV
jgi:SAM-dependent methyltransferase